MNKRFSKLTKSLVLGLSLVGFGASIASAQVVIRPQPGNVTVRPADNFRVPTPPGNFTIERDDQAWVKAVVDAIVSASVSLTGAGERFRLERINFDRLGLYDR